MMKQSGLFRTAVIVGLALATFAVGNTNAWAQGDKAAPFDKVTVSDVTAQRTLVKAAINADTARAIVDACVAYTKAEPGNHSVVVYVLTPTGEVVDAHAMDGALPIAIETGLMKAKTALYARSSSGAVGRRFKTLDGRAIRMDLGRDKGLSYYFVPGGLPIVVDGQMIGAVGVGGGDQDEQCAYQALVKVLGPQPEVAQPGSEKK